MGPGISRLDAGCCVDHLSGQLVLLSSGIEVGQRSEEAVIVPAKLRCLSDLWGGLFIPAEREQADGGSAMGIGVVGLEPELVFVEAKGLVIGSAGPEHVGQVQVGVFVLGVQLDRSSEFSLRIVEPEVY